MHYLHNQFFPGFDTRRFSHKILPQANQSVILSRQAQIQSLISSPIRFLNNVLPYTFGLDKVSPRKGLWEIIGTVFLPVCSSHRKFLGRLLSEAFKGQGGEGWNDLERYAPKCHWAVLRS